MKGEKNLISTQFSDVPPFGSFGGRKALYIRGSVKSRFQVKKPEEYKTIVATVGHLKRF